MSPWYILQSKPNKKEFILQQLKIRNITAYYPEVKVEPVNARSWKIKRYFLGFLFINGELDIIGTSGLKWIPGTLGLVTFGNELASVPDPIRQHVDRLHGGASKYCKKHTPSDRVMIQSGPFTGYQAIFDSYIPVHERVEVLLKMLQDRQIRLDRAWPAVEHDKMCRSNSS